MVVTANEDDEIHEEGLGGGFEAWVALGQLCIDAVKEVGDLRKDLSGERKMERRFPGARPGTKESAVPGEGLDVGHKMKEMLGGKNDVREGDAVHVFVRMHLPGLEKDYATSADRIRAVGGLMLGHAFEDDNKLVDFVKVRRDGISDRGEGESQRE